MLNGNNGSLNVIFVSPRPGVLEYVLQYYCRFAINFCIGKLPVNYFFLGGGSLSRRFTKPTKTGH